MPAETPEPTQEQDRQICGVCGREVYDPRFSWDGRCLRGRAQQMTGDDAHCYRLGYERLAAAADDPKPSASDGSAAAPNKRPDEAPTAETRSDNRTAASLAAEAAPLRAEIERLTKEVAQSDALLAGREQLRADAEAKVERLTKERGDAEANIEYFRRREDEQRKHPLTQTWFDLQFARWTDAKQQETRRADTAEAKILSLEAKIGRLLNLWNEATTALREEGLQATSANPLPLNHAFERVRVLALEAVTGAVDTVEIEKLKRALSLEAEIERLKRDFAKTHAWFLAGELNVRDLQKQLSDALAAASRAREEQGALRAAALETMQERVERWVRLAFHEGALTDRWERAARVVEEAIELAQAEGLDCLDVEAILSRAYDRPAGEPEQEAGGIMVCLLAWAAGRKTSLSECALREIERIEQPTTIEKIRRKQAEKAAAGTGHDFALTPPAAKSNQQQLTGKGAK